MAEPTYKGTDGEMRTLEAHRAHLQSELDKAVDPTSPRYDEDFASKLRVRLRKLPKPSRRTITAPSERQAEWDTGKGKHGAIALVFTGEDAAAVEAFLAAGPDSAHEIIASGRKKLKPTHLHRRVLRALLSAKIERR